VEGIVSVDTSGLGHDMLAEAYPDDIQAALEARERFSRNLPATVDGVGLEFVIETLKRWTPGQTVRVAFQGGNTALHQQIADTAVDWLQYGNLKLDFGKNAHTGAFRTWKLADTEYVAEIRISFDDRGYYSVVGTDSIDRSIRLPGERSMNFGGFTLGLPADWKATVVHEFGHAFGFQHEHQHPIGGCDLDFRWEDDSGYVPTLDAQRQFIVDSAGRRPGIYTVLGGEPNVWPKAKVDHNLRQLENSRAFTVGPFDPHSIMKYYFGAWMFRDAERSHCFSQRNSVLSAQDKRGFGESYPTSPGDVQTIIDRQRGLVNSIVNESTVEPELRERLEFHLERLPK